MSSMLRLFIPTALFTAVSLGSFALWAFGAGRFLHSETSLYIACATVFFVLGGLSLLPFSGVGEKTFNRKIFWLFPASFLLFASFWCAGWLLFRSHFGEIIGSAVGIFAMTAVLKAGLRFSRTIFEAAPVVFCTYTIGYYIGEKLYQDIGGTTGKLAWGLGFGVGLGLGLSYLIQLSQRSRN